MEHVKFRKRQPPGEEVSMPFSLSFPSLPRVATGAFSETPSTLWSLGSEGFGRVLDTKPRLGGVCAAEKEFFLFL